jgi:CRISPR/Cas system CMR subunit Cmr4 (Cas7 group RAMP superfamily)
MQPTLPMMMTPASSLSEKLVRITCALFLNTAQVDAVKVDTLAILKIDDNIKEYHRELKLIMDLQKEI